MRGRQLTAASLLGLLQLIVVATLALAGPDDDTHAAPVTVVAPPVVSSTVVDRVNALPGRPVDAVALSSRSVALESVRGGRSVAAIVVDLRRETDAVYVAGANGSRLNGVLARQVAAVEASYGRTVRVWDLVPARSGDGGHRYVYVLTGIGMLVGLLSAVVITWHEGPRAPTLVRGIRRLVVNTAVAVVAGGVMATFAAGYYDAPFALWWLVTALTVLAGATTTLALESLFGVYGIGVATTVLVLAAAPLVTLVHPLLLPQPWVTVTSWLPHGAALIAGTNVAYFNGEQVLRPVLVLAAWSAISIMTNVVARRELRRESTATG
ncbi:MAG: hypothetical protein JWR27_3029 [Aeromicrobium sp.]|jgi:hypothetical protein|nr:hypothetical protein [Aeromicrobium sp.]